MLEFALDRPSSLTPPSRLSAEWVDECSDAELDSLGFGVICLDAEGTVLRYNLYESRFARLDRNQVVGRNFFAEIAPCARTPEFEGRFRRLARAPAGAVERFEYVFDFKFGAQHVGVEMMTIVAGDAGRFYLLINRKRVAEPRPVPVEQLAALQRVLAPDEAKQGVLRDDLERRFVDVPGSFFGALRATCERLAPEAWSVFANEWGSQWGRRAAVDLEASALEQGSLALAQLAMRDVARLLSGYLAERGWGRPDFDFSATDDGLILVRLDRSALAAAVARAPDRPRAPSAELSCHLVAGCLAGALSAVAGRPLAGREVACVSGSSATCELLVCSHERRVIVDEALATGARGVDAVRTALRRSPRAVASPK